MSNRFELTDDFLAGLAESLMGELRVVYEMVCEDCCESLGDFLKCSSSELVFCKGAASVVGVFGNSVEATLRNYFTAHREAALKDLSRKEAL